MSRPQLLSALSNWLAFAATLAVAFFLTPFLIRHLGTARYDVWCMAEAVLAYFTLLDMGLAACLVRGVARHRAVEEHQVLNRMASTCLALFAAAGLIALMIGLPVMLAIAPRLGAQAADPADVTAFLLVMLANLAVTLPLSVMPSILDGLEKYAAKSMVRIAYLAIRTIAIIVLLHYEAALLPLAILFTLANIAEHLTLSLLAFRFLPSLRFRIHHIDRGSFHEIRRYSIDAFLAMLAGRITVQTGTILIGLMLAGGQVTIFATAARLVEYAKTLLRTITATLTPGVSALEARGDWAGIRTLFLSATRFVLYLVLPFQLGLWFFGEPFLVRWVPEVGAQGTLPLAILSLALTFSVAQSVASRMLYGLGKLWLFARLALLEAAFNIALLLTFIPFFGIAGVAFAVAIPNLIFCIAVIAYTLNVANVNLRDYWIAWRKPLMIACVPALIWLSLPTPPAKWDSIFATIALGLLPYVITIVIFELDAVGVGAKRVPMSIFAGRVRIGRRTALSSSRR